jgi:rpsU-divergently transcribed protein
MRRLPVDYRELLFGNFTAPMSSNFHPLHTHPNPQLPTYTRTRTRTRTQLHPLHPMPTAESWPQAMHLQAQPKALPTTTKHYAEIVDSIWHAAGDKSTDINW